MKAYKNSKNIQIPAYLKPEDYQRLKNLKTSIREDHNQIVPLTEMIRDSVLLFLNTLEKESVEEYLESKGLVD